MAATVLASNRLRSPYVQALILYMTLWRCVSEMGQTNMWVPDIVHKMLPACNDNVELTAGLEHFFSADGGYHLTEQG
jgi:hypothetical protein